MRKYFDQLVLENVIKCLHDDQRNMLRFYLKSGLDLSDLPDMEVSEVVTAWGSKPSLEALILLINSGIDVNAQDEHGNGFLIYASVEQGDLRDIVNFLLSRGADIDKINHFGETALIHSCRVSDILKAKVLLMYTVDVNRKDSRGITALMYAAKMGLTNVIQWLIAAGADVNDKDAKGHSALIWTDGNVVAAQALVFCGADVNTVDLKGNTALMLALSHFRLGNVRILKLLLDKGADVNAVNVHQPDRTALSLCFDKCFFMSRMCVHFVKEDLPQKFLRLLLERGANRCLPTTKHSLMHTVIIDSFVHLIPFFMSCGVAPFKTKVASVRGYRMYSQFDLAMVTSNAQLVKYFLDNWYLTPCDVKALYRGPALLNGLKPCCLIFYKDVLRLLRKMSKEPLSLMALSFIKTSSLIGSTADRRKKIESLRLPALIKKKLLFESLLGKLQPDNDLERARRWARTSYGRIGQFRPPQGHGGRSEEGVYDETAPFLPRFGNCNGFYCCYA